MSVRPTFMGFESAKSSIFTNQKSIDIASNNLANTDTPGYTRQRVERSAAVSYPHGRSSRIATSRIALTGQGVETLGVSQLRDPFLDKRFRDEYTKASYHAQASNLLDDIQSALGDGHSIVDGAGLFGAMNQIYTNINSFMSEATMETEASLVKSAFSNLAQVLQQMDQRLSNVAEHHSDDLEVSVDRVNEITKQISILNGMISNDSTVEDYTHPDDTYSSPNELIDQRNLLIDELSSYGNIHVVALENDKVTVKLGDHMLVDENESHNLMMARNDDETVSITWPKSGENAAIHSGSLRASLDFINGRGQNMQNSNETNYQGIPYYRDMINTYASTFAETVNNILPELDTSKDPPVPLLGLDGKTVYKTLIAARNDDGKISKDIQITAKNISLSQEWLDTDAGYFIFNKDDETTKYAQQMSNALRQDVITFSSHGESYEGTFSDFEIIFLGKLGSDLAFQEGRRESTSLVADDFLDSRDAISGVSQDEETMDMLKYQKSYEAASRMMTVMDDMIDMIINRMGRVGL